jgi:hypothetical protein
MSDNDFFQLFSLTETLKHYDLSLDEVQDGIVDGGNDGGIDAIYTFVDGDPLTDSYRLRPRQDVAMELVIVQCKVSDSFSGTAIDKLIATMSTLFDYGRPLGELRKTYNEGLIERAGLFRSFHQKQIAQISHLMVHFYYISRSEHTHAALVEPVGTLKATAARLFPNSEVDFKFVGSEKLLGYARTDVARRLELPVNEGPLVVSDAGYIGLVSLSNYYRFVADEYGNRRRHLFLSNVRDYEGNVAVNRAIADTLDRKAPEDFWVLNNGVTILAGSARPAYKALVLEDPVVVNGLQTTMEIIHHFRRGKEEDPRLILIRVVIPSTPHSRDRIIVATNSQTSIASGTLRATDGVHRDIEQYFESMGLYYERRRNSHRYEGRPLEAIVTMPYLARCVCAIRLQRPDLAVRINAQSRIVARADIYEQCFDSSQPLELYLNCVLIVRRVEAFLRVADLPSAEDDDAVGVRKRGKFWWLVWHLACYVAQLLVDSRKVTPRSIAEIDINRLDDELLDSAAKVMTRKLREVKVRIKRTFYQVAKGSMALDELVSLMASAREQSHERTGRLTSRRGD